MCDNLVNTEPTNCDNDDRIIIDNYNNLMIDWVMHYLMIEMKDYLMN